MKLISIDPGYDEVALAVFDLDRLNGPTNDLVVAAGALEATHMLQPERGGTAAERLAEISSWTVELVTTYTPRAVYVEIPPTWHARRQKGRIPAGKVLESVAKLNRAVGAVLAAASTVEGVEVVGTPADPMRKDVRLDLVRRCLHRAGYPRQIRNRDVLDAVWIGMAAITATRLTATPAEA